ncbi:MAG: AhpC/TSA family protein [Bacteroidaceae bacterium]|nr:AhpC/TSA family protein [Bacteroidaceae bacterium]
MKQIVRTMWGAVLALVVLTACTEEKKGYTINGEIADIQDGMVYLKKYVEKTFVDVDSAVVANGKFKFEGVASEALAHGLSTRKESRRPLVFFLDNDAMTVSMNEAEKQLTITGSPANDIYLANAPVVRSKGYSLDSLIAAHPASPVAAYFVVKDFAYKLDLEAMKAVRAKFDASLDGTSYIQQIESMIARMEKVQVGSEAPDFTLPDVEGNPVSLSSFRGKYVLLDFWASWCPDCRKENPNIVAAWEKYQNKNFAVLGVSLDRNREQWLAAIEKDNLTWTQVSDLKFWSSDAAVLYCIRWIPMSFLIDPEGKIVAVGLEGEALHNKLEELLK